MRVHCQCSDDYRKYLLEFVAPAMKAQGVEVMVYPFNKIEDAPWGGMLPHRLRLIEHLLDVGEPFVFTGVDVYYRPSLPFLPTVEKALEGVDIVAHGDGMGNVCPDFMAFNPTEATKWWFKAVAQLAPQCGLLDQEAEIRLLGMIKCVKLPIAEFFNLCAVPKLKLNAQPGWMPEPADIPREAKLVHAACVLPGEKWAVLSRVKEICERQDRENTTKGELND
jgi:hypothetical protein